MQHTFTSIKEPVADFKWQKLFFERWPAYEAWLKVSGTKPNLKVALAALEKYMPEMVPLHQYLCQLVRANKMVSCFLTGFQPPVYKSACSQAVSTLDNVQLVRNYDYHAQYFEGVLVHTAWHGKKVMANSDCLIGALDGMNEHGLAVSLTYGGRKIVGYGFGIPFILRYILEFSRSVAEGVAVLERVPSHMSYNVTLTDKTGLVRTVEISPDRKAVITHAAFTTNHQGPVEWAENASFNETAQRAAYLENLLYRGVSGATFTNCFLHSPLYNRQYEKGLGTLYTAVYHPLKGQMEMHWPQYSLYQSFNAFTELKKNINYTQSAIA